MGRFSHNRMNLIIFPINQVLWNNSTPKDRKPVLPYPPIGLAPGLMAQGQERFYALVGNQKGLRRQYPGEKPAVWVPTGRRLKPPRRVAFQKLFSALRRAEDAKGPSRGRRSRGGTRKSWCKDVTVSFRTNWISKGFPARFNGSRTTEVSGSGQRHAPEPPGS